MKRVLLVVDSPQWAWAAIARGIAKFAPPNYEVHVIDQTAYSPLTGSLAFMQEYFDGVCHFSWTECRFRKAGPLSAEIPIKRFSTLVASHGVDFDLPVDTNNRPSCIATRNRNKTSAQERLPQFDSVLCVSRRLHNSCKAMTPHAVRVFPGVDTELFTPSKPPGMTKLRVGWCGQRQSDETKDVKGFCEILVPLIARLHGEVQFIINTRNATKPLPHEEMPHWLKGIDVLISTSCSEGCQMPLLEAAACGRPIIATAVGAADELITDGVNGRLIAPWTNRDEADAAVSEFVRILRELNEDRATAERMGMAARATVEKSWDWKMRAGEWLKEIAGS